MAKFNMKKGFYPAFVMAKLKKKKIRRTIFRGKLVGNIIY